MSGTTGGIGGYGGVYRHYPSAQLSQRPALAPVGAPPIALLGSPPLWPPPFQAVRYPWELIADQLPMPLPVGPPPVGRLGSPASLPAPLQALPYPWSVITQRLPLIPPLVVTVFNTNPLPITWTYAAHANLWRLPVPWLIQTQLPALLAIAPPPAPPPLYRVPAQPPLSSGYDLLLLPIALAPIGDQAIGPYDIAGWYEQHWQVFDPPPYRPPTVQPPNVKGMNTFPPPLALQYAQQYRGMYPPWPWILYASQLPEVQPIPLLLVQDTVPRPLADQYARQQALWRLPYPSIVLASNNVPEFAPAGAPPALPYQLPPWPPGLPYPGGVLGQRPPLIPPVFVAPPPALFETLLAVYHRHWALWRVPWPFVELMQTVPFIMPPSLLPPLPLPLTFPIEPPRRLTPDMRNPRGWR